VSELDLDAIEAAIEARRMLPVEQIPALVAEVRDHDGAVAEVWEIHLKTECGAIPPNVRGPVPCHLPPGHDGQHFSTSGCAGSEIRWDRE
jgi:hypothetical protein